MDLMHILELKRHKKLVLSAESYCPEKVKSKYFISVILNQLIAVKIHNSSGLCCCSFEKKASLSFQLSYASWNPNQ